MKASEKRRLLDIFEERRLDFEDDDGWHEERWHQYLEIIGCFVDHDFRSKRGMVKLSGLFVPRDLAFRALVLGFLPPRNKRRERAVRYVIRSNLGEVHAPTRLRAMAKALGVSRKRGFDKLSIFDPGGIKIITVKKGR
jgi:hypothetical protein